MTWTAPTGVATGGTAIDSMHLEWDYGSDGVYWQDLQGGPTSADYSLLTTHVVTSGVTAGQPYKFRVRAHNVHGWGPYSELWTVVAAAAPEAPTAAVTSIENTFVKIYWDEPAASSATIDGYEVYIAAANGTFINEKTYCDGFSSATILASHYCLVPMTVLRSTKYNLVLGNPIRVKVRAHNLYGFGPESPINTGGVNVQTEPGQVLNLHTGPGTAENAIELIWNALTTDTERGGTSIMSYEVQWDAGAATGSYTTLTGYLSDFTPTTLTVTSGVQPGYVFSFRVRAKNMWGWGPFSTIL